MKTQKLRQLTKNKGATKIVGLTVLLIILNGMMVMAGDIYPETRPYEKGYIKKPDGTSIYYEKIGNKKGRALVILNDGPGSNMYTSLSRFFNPEVYDIIQFNIPKKNGKSQLINEINNITAVTDHLGLNKYILVGNGWGATLAITYATKYPANITGLILSNVIWNTSEDIQKFYAECAKKDPQRYREILNETGEDTDNAELLSEAIYDEISRGNSVVSENFRILLALLNYSGGSELTALSCVSEYRALTTAYYLMNNFFIEDSLTESVDRISNIPAYIVVGDRNPLTSLEKAMELYKRFPKGALDIVAGAKHNDYSVGLAIKEGSEWLDKKLNQEYNLVARK